MNKPNLRFTVLAAVGVQALACSFHSNDSGSAPGAEDGANSTISGSSGGSTSQEGPLDTIVDDPSATSTSTSFGPTSSTTSAGGTMNKAPIASNAGAGGSPASGGAPNSDDETDAPIAAAGAAGDANEPEPVDEPQSATPVLVISEYIKGAGNDKAIEITNVGSDPVPENLCSLEMYTNGRTDPFRTFVLDRQLAAGQSLVLCHSSSNTDILARCNIVNGSLTFNGDDALVVACSDEVVDSFGQVGTLPGDGLWGADESYLVDHTLRRLCSSGPRKDPAAPFALEEYFTVADEANPVFDDLGTYVCE